MANRSSRRGASGSRGRGRHQPQNPQQNPNFRRDSGQNRPSGESSAAQSSSPGSIPTQNSGQGQSFCDVVATQSARPTAITGQISLQDHPGAVPVQSSGRGRSFRDAAVGHSAGPRASGGDGGRGVAHQLSSDPAVTMTPVAPPSSDLQSPKISEPTSESRAKVPIKRPDKRGNDNIPSLELLVNHFRVSFKSDTKIYHYNLGIQRKHLTSTPPKAKPPIANLSKSESLLVKQLLFPQHPTTMAYDGKQNIYSVVELEQWEDLQVEVPQGEGVEPRRYGTTLKLVASYDLMRILDYINGALDIVPREILQALDVVMRENPSLSRIPFGRSFYSKKGGKEVGVGIIASTGFHQSLKLTAQGLSICMDYKVITFREPILVLEFLRKHFERLNLVLDTNTSLNSDQSKALEAALKGWKVTVIHRKTSPKYVVAGLTRDIPSNLKFEKDKDSKRVVSVVEYFRETYDKEVEYKRLPCLDLSKNKRANYVPMEFCVLLEGQRYPLESLKEDDAQKLTKMAVITPANRKEKICTMIKAKDGPCGGYTAHQFHIEVNKAMTEVNGRVLKKPQLQTRGMNNKSFPLTPRENGQWNMNGRKVYKGMDVTGWAILDFTSSSRLNWLDVNKFIRNIVQQATMVGIVMRPKPLFPTVPSGVDVLSNENRLHHTLKVLQRDGKGKLQILFCAMEKGYPGYSTLKRICETDIGIVTQCFQSCNANTGAAQYYVNLLLKVNAKLGGSNMVLFDRLPRLDNSHDRVMFMGADVNHPSSQSRSSVSIAAVTASMNWPDENQYAFRLYKQTGRTEEILDIGNMCLDLVKSYARKNGEKKPGRIILFRDGVSDSQFDMVLNKELEGIKNAFLKVDYQPTITLVVAQKRHQTRFFPKEDGDISNIAPGTVIDATITHLHEFDFYLCSHHGILGTSRPTHYHVLHDDHGFSSDEIQKIIYNLCYTFPRCTKPVSLVPPVLCADLAAYRGRLYVSSEETSRQGAASTPAPPSSSSSSTSSASVVEAQMVALHQAKENLQLSFGATNVLVVGKHVDAGLLVKEELWVHVDANPGGPLERYFESDTSHW